MRVFIGYECSGVVRAAFERRGHDVVSCDLKPSEDNSPRHIVGDVFETLEALKASGWVPDLAVFHPPCTYHANSAAWAFNDPDLVRYPDKGGYHQKVKPGTLVGLARRLQRERATSATWSALKASRFSRRLKIRGTRGTSAPRWASHTTAHSPMNSGTTRAKKPRSAFSMNTATRFPSSSRATNPDTSSRAWFPAKKLWGKATRRTRTKGPHFFRAGRTKPTPARMLWGRGKGATRSARALMKESPSPWPNAFCAISTLQPTGGR